MTEPILLHFESMQLPNRPPEVHCCSQGHWTACQFLIYWRRKLKEADPEGLQTALLCCESELLFSNLPRLRKALHPLAWANCIRAHGGWLICHPKISKAVRSGKLSELMTACDILTLTQACASEAGKLVLLEQMKGSHEACILDMLPTDS